VKASIGDDKDARYMWSSNLDVVLDVSNRVVLNTIVQIFTQLT